MGTMSISAILDCPLFRSSFFCPPMILTFPASNNPRHLHTPYTPTIVLLQQIREACIKCVIRKKKIVLTQGLLGSGIVCTNQTRSASFVLRKGKSAVATQALDVADLVNCLAETLHARAVIGNVELLNLLHIVVRPWEECAFHAIVVKEGEWLGKQIVSLNDHSTTFTSRCIYDNKQKQNLLFEGIITEDAGQRQKNDGQPEHRLAVKGTSDSIVLGSQSNLGTNNGKDREEAHPEEHRSRN